MKWPVAGLLDPPDGSKTSGERDVRQPTRESLDLVVGGGKVDYCERRLQGRSCDLADFEVAPRPFVRGLGAAVTLRHPGLVTVLFDRILLGQEIAREERVEGP